MGQMLRRAAGDASAKHLSFAVAGTTFGIPIVRVKEVLPYEAETKVPGAPAAVRGVIDLRGEAVPVFDLGIRFGRPEVVPTERTCVLIVEALAADGPVLFGLIADRVNEVLDLAPRQVAPPPSVGGPGAAELLRGVGSAGEELVLLLDVDAARTGLSLTGVAGPAAAPYRQ
jgi:purine-binding chemotaxis protein CheW